jgi:hypothetical protein
MLERISLVVHGRADQRVRTYAAKRCETLVRTLFVDAVSAWSRENFLRFGDHEVDCTVRFFDWCQRTLQEDPGRWPSVRVQYDGTTPTLEILRGVADPKTSPRPDVIIFIGHITLHLEAKRLATSDQLPKLYVQKGMLRFLGGSYAWSPGSRGAMLSYNMVDSVRDGIDHVNGVIKSSQDMGPDGTLEFREPLHPKLDLFVSEHGAPPLTLLHFAVDMR